MIFAHEIDGGWNTEAGPSAPYRLRAQDAIGIPTVSVPWLVNARNIIYSRDGWPRKMPGASNVNGTATGATDVVMGLFDYWRSNTSGDPTQQRLLYSGTQYYRESGGTLTSIDTGNESGRMPWFEVMNDACVIATTSTVDVPSVWDQTTFANLGGSPPNFAFHSEHKGRMFAAGVVSNKSRLYYSAFGAHDDWTSATSGSIDVAPDDGDVITGLRSHKGELIIFKGPNRGAIYRLTGAIESGAAGTAYGSAVFALVPFVRGIGATNNHSIILGPGGDLWFWDDGGIHSLTATDAFGDYAPSFLSAQIASYFTDQLNHNRFDFVQGVNFAGGGYALWTVTRAGSSTHDAILMLDYNFQPFRFALWTAYAVASLAMMRDASRLTIPWGGTYTGRAIRMNRSARNVAGTAYTGLFTLPYLGYSDPFMDKVAPKGRTSFAPKGDTTFTVAWTRDTRTQQTASISQGGAAALGDAVDNFLLDSDVLSGGGYTPAFFDMGGSFKEIQLELSQGTNDVDMEVHGLALEVEFAGMGTTATVG